MNCILSCFPDSSTTADNQESPAPRSESPTTSIRSSVGYIHQYSLLCTRDWLKTISMPFSWLRTKNGSQSLKISTRKHDTFYRTWRSMCGFGNIKINKKIRSWQYVLCVAPKKHSLWSKGYNIFIFFIETKEFQFSEESIATGWTQGKREKISVSLAA